VSKFAEFKNNLKDLLEDNVQTCINELKRLVSDVTFLDNLRLISTNYKAFKSAQNLNTYGREELEIERRRVVSSLLNLINDLKQSDFKKTAFETEGIEETILVVSSNDTSLVDMRRFFTSYFFKNVHYDASCKEVVAETYDLIVFDNRLMGKAVGNAQAEEALDEAARNHLVLLKKYLEETKFNIVYYGEFLHLLNNYRDRVNAANSKFTLYARVKETIDCMKMYKED
jgi:hypothetical protein